MDIKDVLRRMRACGFDEIEVATIEEIVGNQADPLTDEEKRSLIFFEGEGKLTRCDVWTSRLPAIKRDVPAVYNAQKAIEAAEAALTAAIEELRNSL
jgi:hypothetical protein